MLYQDDKERTIVLGINQDISEKILYQQGLEKNNEELIKYNKELSSFNYVVSHDLQEPLRKIRMFVSRIKDDPNNHLSEKSIGFFEKVQDSSMRMQNLIDDLLAYSRINRSDLKKEQVDLNSILEQVIQDWAHIIEDRRVMLSYDKLPIVNGYIFQLHQLFSNIIGNALKYSKPDIPPNIHISHSIKEGADIKFPIIEKLAQYHEIKVSDNGIGFESKYAEEIFGLFKRQHNKDSYKGTGIGLAICRKIVEQHHGYIFAEGVRDIGAAFYIYLPYESSSPAS
jgi:light-regulated signal transduction histidine kinase (bacteriophytochrome)